MGRITAILIIALAGMVFMNDGKLPRGSKMSQSGGGFGDYSNASGASLKGLVEAVN